MRFKSSNRLGSLNTKAASSNAMRCLAILARFFGPSHSKITVYTVYQYIQPIG